MPRDQISFPLLSIAVNIGIRICFPKSQESGGSGAWADRRTQLVENNHDMQAVDEKGNLILFSQLCWQLLPTKL